MNIENMKKRRNQEKEQILDNNQSNNLPKSQTQGIINHNNRKRKLRKADMILVGTMLAVILVSFLIIEIFVKKQGTMVEVKVDGKVVYELPLDTDTQISLDGYQGGTNTIVIENDTVKMTDADCPDKICVHTGTISKTGETIVCLPHRVVVEIVGNDNELDSVVK